MTWGQKHSRYAFPCSCGDERMGIGAYPVTVERHYTIWGGFVHTADNCFPSEFWCGRMGTEEDF